MPDSFATEPPDITDPLDPNAEMQTILHLVECDDTPATVTELLSEFGIVFIHAPDPDERKPGMMFDLPPAHLLPLGLKLVELHQAWVARHVVRGVR